MTRATINSGEVEYVAALKTPWGSEPVTIAEQQVSEYQRDPDGFAAAYFALSRDEYQRWIERNGVALCGGTTKSGKPCSNPLTGGYQLKANEWKARHRAEYCKTHGGE
jgi:hypothetical protein